MEENEQKVEETQAVELREAKGLDPVKKKQVRTYRRNLWKMILLSSGLDIAIAAIGGPLAVTSFGGSIVVDEIIEYFISNLLAKNKMRLKKRYKIVGFIPIPGLTSLTVQALMAMRRSRNNPEKIIDYLNEGDD